MTAISMLTGRENTPRAISIWLFGICALVFLMVMVGGLTRLTDSGLSITEWKPITGAVPPLSDEAWRSEFDKYKQIPEYDLVNKGMSLDEFKEIYWWEWGHRLLGRLIGVAFFVPLVWFAATRQLDRYLMGRLAALFVLGGLQGALGWYMVTSGLSERVDVSQYRLAAHLGLAVAIYAYSFWLALHLWSEGRPHASQGHMARGGAFILLGLIYLQIIAGAFVAGLDAGFAYNTWPLMDGTLIPSQLFVQDPWWANLFENPKLVQFNHRLLAYVVLAAAAVHWSRLRHSDMGPSALLLLAALVGQALIGIWTLVTVVPIALGAAHQAGAMIALSAALYHASRSVRWPGSADAPSPSGVL